MILLFESMCVKMVAYKSVLILILVLACKTTIGSMYGNIIDDIIDEARSALNYSGPDFPSRHAYGNINLIEDINTSNKDDNDLMVDSNENETESIMDNQVDTPEHGITYKKFTSTTKAGNSITSESDITTNTETNVLVNNNKPINPYYNNLVTTFLVEEITTTSTSKDTMMTHDMTTDGLEFSNPNLLEASTHQGFDDKTEITKNISINDLPTENSLSNLQSNELKDKIKSYPFTVNTDSTTDISMENLARITPTEPQNNIVDSSSLATTTSEENETYNNIKMTTTENVSVLTISEATPTRNIHTTTQTMLPVTMTNEKATYGPMPTTLLADYINTLPIPYGQPYNTQPTTIVEKDPNEPELIHIIPSILALHKTHPTTILPIISTTYSEIGSIGYKSYVSERNDSNLKETNQTTIQYILPTEVDKQTANKTFVKTLSPNEDTVPQFIVNQRQPKTIIEKGLNESLSILPTNRLSKVDPKTIDSPTTSEAKSVHYNPKILFGGNSESDDNIPKPIITTAEADATKKSKKFNDYKLIIKFKNAQPKGFIKNTK